MSITYSPSPICDCSGAVFDSSNIIYGAFKTNIYTGVSPGDTNYTLYADFSQLDGSLIPGSWIDRNIEGTTTSYWMTFGLVKLSDISGGNISVFANDNNNFNPGGGFYLFSKKLAPNPSTGTYGFSKQPFDKTYFATNFGSIIPVSPPNTISFPITNPLQVFLRFVALYPSSSNTNLVLDDGAKIFGGEFRQYNLELYTTIAPITYEVTPILDVTGNLANSDEPIRPIRCAVYIGSSPGQTKYTLYTDLTQLNGEPIPYNWLDAIQNNSGASNIYLLLKATKLTDISGNTTNFNETYKPGGALYFFSQKLKGDTQGNTGFTKAPFSQIYYNTLGDLTTLNKTEPPYTIDFPINNPTSLLTYGIYLCGSSSSTDLVAGNIYEIGSVPSYQNSTYFTVAPITYSAAPMFNVSGAWTIPTSWDPIQSSVIPLVDPYGTVEVKIYAGYCTGQTSYTLYADFLRSDGTFIPGSWLQDYRASDTAQVTNHIFLVYTLVKFSDIPNGNITAFKSNPTLSSGGAYYFLTYRLNPNADNTVGFRKLPSGSIYYNLDGSYNNLLPVSPPYTINFSIANPVQVLPIACRIVPSMQGRSIVYPPVSNDVYALNAIFPKYTSGLPAEINCLLKGTKVRVAKGYVCIENIKEGDVVRSHNGKLVKVLKAVSFDCKPCYTMGNPSLLVYKVAAGKYGCTEDLYISYWHQILINGVLVAAKDAGLPLAPQKSDYTFYHLCLENYKENHLVVNGGCVVESWSGELAHILKPAVKITVQKNHIVDLAKVVAKRRGKPFNRLTKL